MVTLTVEYSIYGELTPDLASEPRARQMWALRHEKPIFYVATDNVINALRVLVCEGVIPHDQLQFRFKGQIIQPDKDGRLPEWPDGFCDTTKKLLIRLI